MGKGVLFLVLFHCFTYLVASLDELTPSKSNPVDNTLQLESNLTLPENLSKSSESTVLTLPGIGTSPENVILSLQTQGDGLKKTLPRKGIQKEPVKGRKGADPAGAYNITTSPMPVLKFKPLASETLKSEDEVSEPPSHQTALIVGLSLGIAMVLILAAVTFWRLRDVWERRQYKRVDFLIDGMYTDT